MFARSHAMPGTQLNTRTEPYQSCGVGPGQKRYISTQQKMFFVLS